MMRSINPSSPPLKYSPNSSLSASSATIVASDLALGLMHVIFQKRIYDPEFVREFTNGSYLVRADTGKFLHGKDIGMKKENAYIIWHEPTDSYKAMRRSNVKEACLSGSFKVNGIECKPALHMLEDLTLQYTPKETSEISGVQEDLIIKLAEKIASTKNVVFYTHMGFTRTYHGDISLRGLISVASITGHVTTSFSSGYMPAVLN